MATRKDRGVLQQVQALFDLGTFRGLTDGQLLERFATAPGEGAELAFAALVERHGAMVLRVCRAVLRDPHDAQDAFQATFLLLVTKARGLWVRDSLGPWLHQVAYRTAMCARGASARRRRHERAAAERAAAPTESPVDHGPGPEWERALHDAIEQLPERYRVPIVLCDLEGQTCEEAARRMGRPVGTVKCWRSRGRERLRERLTRLGLTLPSEFVPKETVPPSRADDTVRSALRTRLKGLNAGTVPAPVLAMAKGVLSTMLFSKVRTRAALTALTLLAAGAGFGAVSRVLADNDEPPRPVSPTAAVSTKPRAATPLANEQWPLSLSEAVRIGLDNSGAIGNTLPTRDGLTISPARPNISTPKFNADVMAVVRSIGQQYWSLAQQCNQLWATEKAVELAEGVFKRARAKMEMGSGNAADVAESRTRLEQFQLDLVTRTSDVIATERQLRNLMGLPPTDKRRIVPTSKPRDDEARPDWEGALKTMMARQPDIVQAKASVAEAEDQLSQHPTETPARESFQMTPDGATAGGPRARATLLRQRAALQQITHQTTHSLARFFLEVDANFRRLQQAVRFGASATEMLEAYREFHDDGRIPISRYLDAISQYTVAVANEAQAKVNYNISLIALEEAKGTLLDHEHITLAPRTNGVVPDNTFRVKSYPPAQDSDAAGAAPAPEPSAPQPGAMTPGTSGRTFSFQLTLSGGPKPVELRGSFTLGPPAEGSHEHIKSDAATN